MQAAFIYDAALSRYQLSENHPFKPVRLELTRTLLELSGLLSAEHLVAPAPLAEKALYAVHERRYVELVKRASGTQEVPEAYSYGLGTGDNPIFPQMHEAIMRVCAATVTAIDVVASGKAQRAVNLSGGLHHAHRAKASGFCLYNDLALGIHHAVTNYGLRVAYVDLDAHHGDGVQELFYDASEVMTISLHESGRYLFPGTGYTYETGQGAGRGLSVNVPLEPYTDDASYLAVFEAVVPMALRQFRPDLIVLQAGADMHRYDPLADLLLSVQGMAQSYRRMCELADELCGGRLVATGGGGYDPYRTVPRAWAYLWAHVSAQPISSYIPDRWHELWQSESPVPLPETLLDSLAEWPEVARRQEIASQNLATVKRLLQALAPIWQERFGTAHAL
jgi:acetoin utilization protein AcuC